jgi:hypothetical protein
MGGASGELDDRDDDAGEHEDDDRHLHPDPRRGHGFAPAAP